MRTTKAVEKRTRKTQITKGELKCLSLIPGQHERSICFRSVHYPTYAIDFYCIPVDDLDNASKEGQPPELLYGTPPKYIFPFQSSTTISTASSFVSVGNTLYCVGGHETTGKGEETAAIYRFDITGGNGGSWYRNSFDMCCPRYGPGTIVMDGKLFVIGAQEECYNFPLAEVFDPLSKSSIVIESTPKSLCEVYFFATAALRDRNEILVACVYTNVAYLLDVKTGAWVQFDPNVSFSGVNNEAAVVLKTTMCWYNHRLRMIVAYDLNLKTWFKTSIKYLNRVGRRFKDVYYPNISLFPLDENHLCFIWGDHVTPCLLHFTKVRVSLLDGKFRAAVACSRSYVLRENSGFIDGLLLDLSPTPEERSTSGEIANK